MSWMDEVNKKITGRVALLSDEESEALYSIAYHPGDYVEIGTLWGGTAILAALSKESSSGHVYTIDFMKGGYWDHGDPTCKHEKPTAGIILDNLQKLGVAHRVSIIKAASNPWPLPDSIKPTTVLIDGDHSYEGCLQDWKNVRPLRPRFVAFHDYGSPTCPGVTRVVNEVVAKDKRYRRVNLAGTLAVYEWQV